MKCAPRCLMCVRRAEEETLSKSRSEPQILLGARLNSESAARGLASTTVAETPTETPAQDSVAAEAAAFNRSRSVKFDEAPKKASGAEPTPKAISIAMETLEEKNLWSREVKASDEATPATSPHFATAPLPEAAPIGTPPPAALTPGGAKLLASRSTPDLHTPRNRANAKLQMYLKKGDHDAAVKALKQSLSGNESASEEEDMELAPINAAESGETPPEEESIFSTSGAYLQSVASAPLDMLSWGLGFTGNNAESNAQSNPENSAEERKLDIWSWGFGFAGSDAQSNAQKNAENSAEERK
mmetsp:Transcript_144270/g.268861  ORF Transcript_144270/g.268861 Transcript_144270/m.268861 type:complete len:300 (-) Transcript_144270:121-1020(-)